LKADYITVVEDKHVMSAEYRLPLLVKVEVTDPAAWSLCNS